MLYFKTRAKAQAFATKTGHRYVDNGAAAGAKRWAVQLMVAQAA